jgi:phenylacetate-CoA ligase
MSKRRAIEYLQYLARYNFYLEKLLKRISTLHGLSNDEIEAVKNKQFIEQLHRAYSQSKFYNKLYKSLNININEIKSVEDIDKLPIIDKQQVRGKIDEILIGNKLFLNKGYTSGTSGTPLVVFRNYKSILSEHAYLWHNRIQHGLNIGDPIVSLRGNLDRNTLKYYNKSENTLYLSSYLINPQNINQYKKWITDFKPKAILAYPSSAYLLAMEFLQSDLNDTIPLTFTSSEKLYQFQKALMVDVFRTKVIDWYGNAERSIAIEQCIAGNYHESPLYSFNEYKDNCTITTSFLNSKFPLIRYKVEDIIVPSKNINCPCGLKTKIIDLIEGRDDDYLILPDNTKIGRMDLAFKNVNNIEYVQMMQNDINSIDVNIVPSDKFTDVDKSIILSNIRDRIGNEIKISINLVSINVVKKSESGKFKLVINNIINNSKQ